MSERDIPILEVHDLSHVYSKGTPFEQKALDHVNLNVERGEFLAIIGHTGSGKSTLIQHLNLGAPSDRRASAFARKKYFCLRLRYSPCALSHRTGVPVSGISAV